MSIGYKIYFDSDFRDDSRAPKVDYFIEKEYQTTFVEGVSLRMCIAMEIVKFDDRNRHKEIIRLDRDGKVKEHITYSWKDRVNIIDHYRHSEHTRRDIIEYDFNFHPIKKEWYDVEKGDLVYRGTETTKYDEKGNEVYRAWINADRNHSCWKWVTEYSNNGKKVKKSHYKGPQLNNFTHSLFIAYDDNGNEIENRIVHREGTIHSRDSIEINKYEDGRIISHVGKYIFSDGTECKFEEDIYTYLKNKLSKIHHLDNSETLYSYNHLGQLSVELDLKDGKVDNVTNFFYDERDNEILRVWNRLVEDKRISIEYMYDANGNKVYEKRTVESSKEKKIVEKEWKIFYQKSSVLLSKDYF